VQQQLQDHFGETDTPAQGSPPNQVTAVPRLRDDLLALHTFFAIPDPPKRYIRGSSLVSLIYGFGDFSGAGFGSSFQSSNGIHYRYGIWGDDLTHHFSNFREAFNLLEGLEHQVASMQFPSSDGIHYRYGIWGDDLTQHSSNFREAFNLLEGLEHQVAGMQFPYFDALVNSLTDAVHRGELDHTEIILFMENAVAEGVFYKGSSPSRQLFDLILKLKCLELHHGLYLNLIHVAGTRMQEQGTDGLSRGDLTTGIMNGIDMLHFVPLHLSAVERSSSVLPWISSWLPDGCTLVPLLPVDWFFKGHSLTGGNVNMDGLWVPSCHPSGNTCFLWTPPPAAGNVPIKQLSYARHKCLWQLHLFVCPRLLTHLWRKQLYKIADLVFTLPAASRPFVWPYELHEPLVVGIILPFLSSTPWIRRQTPTLLEVERQLRGVWTSTEGSECPILRQLWC